MTQVFMNEIERLKKMIYTLGARVVECLELAVKSILEKDIELAQRVIANDCMVDEMEVEVEEECLKVLALHQPVAIDLRFIITVLKLNGDLERIGDLAADIAKNGITVTRLPQPRIPIDLHRMSHLVTAIVRKSLDSLINLDAYLAREVIRDDDEINAMKAEMKADIIAAIRRDPEHAEALATLLVVSNRLERIGDHATNIAEDVIYMVEAEIVRHSQTVKARNR